MGAFVRGDIIVIPFPYTDLSSSKKRPALVIASLTGTNLILCQITSQNRSSRYSIELNSTDLQSGTLKNTSYAQTDIVFTAASQLVEYKLGRLSSKKLKEVTTKLISIIEGKL